MSSCLKSTDSASGDASGPYLPLRYAERSGIEDELELAREHYVGEASMGERGRELSREIVRMSSYRDALRTKLDRLNSELSVLNGTL